MTRAKRSPLRIRLRVANRPGQIFHAGKGRGSYRRCAVKQFIRQQLPNDD